MTEPKKSKQAQGKSNRRKGGVIERAIVADHLEMGVPAKRVPLSGAARGYKGDLQIEVLGGIIAEVKSRKTGKGFTTLEGWLGEHEVLFLKRDRQKPMVVLPWSTYRRLVQALPPELRGEK